jgi:hypothetical protein
VAFRVQPEGKSGYVAAVVFPFAKAYQEWFPPEKEKAKLRGVFSGSEEEYTAATGHPMLLVARLEKGTLQVLRAMRLKGLRRGDLVRLQVKTEGDLIVAAARWGSQDPIYVTARDSSCRSGAVGLMTHRSAGSFANLFIWPLPQMIRHLWKEEFLSTGLSPQPQAK